MGLSTALGQFDKWHDADQFYGGMDVMRDIQTKSASEIQAWAAANPHKIRSQVTRDMIAGLQDKPKPQPAAPARSSGGGGSSNTSGRTDYELGPAMGPVPGWTYQPGATDHQLAAANASKWTESVGPLTPGGQKFDGTSFGEGVPTRADLVTPSSPFEYSHYQGHGYSDPNKDKYRMADFDPVAFTNDINRNAQEWVRADDQFAGLRQATTNMSDYYRKKADATSLAIYGDGSRAKTYVSPKNPEKVEWNR